MHLIFIKQLVYLIQCTCTWVLWRGIYLADCSIQCLNNCSQVDSTIIQHFNVQPGSACNLSWLKEGQGDIFSFYIGTIYKDEIIILPF